MKMALLYTFALFGLCYAPNTYGAEQPVSVLKLWEDTRSTDPEIRKAAIERLAEHGDAAVPILMGIWERGDAKDIAVAYTSICKLKPESPLVIDTLCKSLRTNTNHNIREYAAMALGRLNGSGDTIPSLIAGIKDADMMVSNRSMDSLSYFGKASKPACPVIIEFINRIMVEKKDVHTARDLEYATWAVRSLASIEPEENKDLILRHAAYVIRLGKKDIKHWTAACNGALAMEHMGCSFKEAMQLLTEYLDDMDDTVAYRDIKRSVTKIMKKMIDDRMEKSEKQYPHAR